jgi:hypothetical protein
MPERKACREMREKRQLSLRAPPGRMHIAIGFMNGCRKVACEARDAAARQCLKHGSCATLIPRDTISEFLDMPSLTISVDEQVLKKARIRALEEGTSVDALLRSYLERYVGDVETRRKATRNILALSRSSRATRGRRRATRDELRERDR